MKKLFGCLLVLMLLFSAACAEVVSFDATVVSTQTDAVLATASGKIAQLPASVGESVLSGAEIAVLYPTCVCAEQAGTVTLYGGESDSIAALITRYGSVATVEPDERYSVSASTKNAYDSIETQLVHNGETVFVRSTEDTAHNGLGVVYGVSGTSYSVELTSGDFDIGESVTIFRGTEYAYAQRLGKGTIARVEPVSYTGGETGTVSRLLVENGQHVEVGDVLYEILSVDPSSVTSYGSAMTAQENSVVAEISVAVGDAVEQGAVIAKLYPDSAMRLEVEVPEADMGNIALGGKVTIEFNNGVKAEGVIERVSSVAITTEEGDDTVAYAVYVSFTTEQPILYGMTATVTTAETAE